MIIQEVYDYVAKRADKVEQSTFFAELNRAYAVIWYQVDTKDAVFEMELEATSERQITLPWFVLDIKGVRDFYEVPLALMTPRPYYNQSAPHQSDYEWRLMHRTPLFRPVGVIGRLTIRPRKRLATPVTVNLRGPGEFGVTEIEPVNIAAGQVSGESSAVFSDLTSLSKSAITTADLEIFDAQGTKVGYLPADKTDVWCQLVQLTDTRMNRVVSQTNRFFTILFKKQPPTLSSLSDAVPTEYGLIIQDMIVESLLGGVRDDMAQKVSEKAGGRAVGTLSGIMNKSAEPLITKISTGRSPYNRRRRFGYL